MGKKRKAKPELVATEPKPLVTWEIDTARGYVRVGEEEFRGTGQACQDWLLAKLEAIDPPREGSCTQGGVGHH